VLLAGRGVVHPRKQLATDSPVLVRSAACTGGSDIALPLLSGAFLRVGLGYSTSHDGPGHAAAKVNSQ
jgi:hypothetical protein